jgi:hypothetical protein
MSALRTPEDLVGVSRQWEPDPAPATRSGKARFVVERFDAIEIGEEPEWRIKDVLPRTGLVVIIGEPGTGKSFLASSIALHIAEGRPWAGKPVEAGPVVYLTPEGVSGFRKRLVAYRENARPKSNLPFHLITDAADLGHAPGDALILADRIIEQVGKVAVVVVDTLARSMGGADESSTADMSVLVENCDHVASELGCVVVLVHHVGKDPGRGGRGSSVLKASADVEMLVEGTDRTRTATITKSKDGEAGLVLRFDLERVDLAVGEKLTSSCVVKVVEEWSYGARAKVAKVTGPAKLALEALQLAIAEGGEVPPITGRQNRTKMAVRSDLWRRYCETMQISEADTPDAKRKAFKRAADRLQELGKIGVWNEWVWIND